MSSDRFLHDDQPEQGRSDEKLPQFSYGKIIWKAVVNVLQKVVTAPFRAIGKLLAHLREREHDKAFYKLCTHMEPAYHQLEFEVRIYLTHLETTGERLWAAE